MTEDPVRAVYWALVCEELGIEATVVASWVVVTGHRLKADGEREHVASFDVKYRNDQSATFWLPYDRDRALYAQAQARVGGG